MPDIGPPGIILIVAVLGASLFAWAWRDTGPMGRKVAQQRAERLAKTSIQATAHVVAEGGRAMQVKTFTYKRKGKKYFVDEMFGDEMDAHIQGLLGSGWEPMNSATDPGHVRAGKTLGLMALTGGLSLFFGASRTAEKITLTFKKA
jgi:hypothetical protein